VFVIARHAAAHPVDIGSLAGHYKKTPVSALSAAFPMFVPSLSWQNDRFYIQMAQKDRFVLTVAGNFLPEQVDSASPTWCSFMAAYPSVW
jgi:hypothetical protein